MVELVSVVSVVVAVLLLVVAVAWAVTGVLGVTGRLRRNRWLGVRADDSMASDEAFALANRVAGPGQIGAAAILVLGAVLTLGVDSAWSVVFGVAAFVAGLFIVGLVSALGVRAAAALPVEDSGCGCCSSTNNEAPAETTEHDDPASDCGTSSCGSCSLRGVCSDETAQA